MVEAGIFASGAGSRSRRCWTARGFAQCDNRATHALDERRPIDRSVLGRLQRHRMGKRDRLGNGIIWGNRSLGRWNRLGRRSIVWGNSTTGSSGATQTTGSSGATLTTGSSGQLRRRDRLGQLRRRDRLGRRRNRLGQLDRWNRLGNGIVWDMIVWGNAIVGRLKTVTIYHLIMIYKGAMQWPADHLGRIDNLLRGYHPSHRSIWGTNSDVSAVDLSRSVPAAGSAIAVRPR